MRREAGYPTANLHDNWGISQSGCISDISPDILLALSSLRSLACDLASGVFALSIAVENPEAR
jgi:hypothetical protein